MSESTEAYDLGDKFGHYRQIPELEAVLYVSEDKRRLELRRRADGWTPTVAEAGKTLEIDSPNCSVSVDEIYEGVLS